MNLTVNKLSLYFQKFLIILKKVLKIVLNISSVYTAAFFAAILSDAICCCWSCGSLRSVNAIVCQSCRLQQSRSCSDRAVLGWCNKPEGVAIPWPMRGLSSLYTLLTLFNTFFYCFLLAVRLIARETVFIELLQCKCTCLSLIE